MNTSMLIYRLPNISKRLRKERYKTFWYSGLLRGGNTQNRISWILQRYKEVPNIDKGKLL